MKTELALGIDKTTDISGYDRSPRDEYQPVTDVKVNSGEETQPGASLASLVRGD